MPEIDTIIAYDAPWVKGPARGDLSDRRLLAALRRNHYDAAIIFTVCTQSALPAALMCRLAGIPLRLAHSRENPDDPRSGRDDEFLSKSKWERFQVLIMGPVMNLVPPQSRGRSWIVRLGSVGV